MSGGHTGEAAGPERLRAALHRALGETIRAALAAPDVVEIMVNGDGAVWIDRLGSGRRAAGVTLPPGSAETVIRLIAHHGGAVADRDHPAVSGTLPEGGERFQGMLPPVVAAPLFCIRKPPGVIFGLAEYVAQGVMTEAMAAVLRAAVAGRVNILVAGGTGSGKTTLCNALLAEPGFAASRVVILEDTPELRCAAPDRVQLLTRTAEPEVTMTRLLKDTLRLRPDRIVIGEVRDGAALAMVKAWNTGHPGGVSTLHANSAEEALLRLEDLIREATPSLPVRSIAAAIGLIVFLRRSGTGRRVEQVVRVAGHRGGAYVLEPAA